jgi:hypothetical protein
MVAAIWIDVHPTGKIQPTHYTHSTLSPHMVPDHTYLTGSIYSNLSHSHQHIWTDPLLPRRRAPDPAHNTPTDWSMGSYQLLSQNSQEVVGKSQGSVDDRLLGLPNPYHQHVISTLNTCSWGLTHRSLTDTGGAYNHLRSPRSLRLSNFNIASSEMVMWSTYRRPMTFRPLSVYRSIYLRLTISNVIQILTRSSRVILEGNHNVSTVPINYYQPNAQSFLT